mmetsp:Transcript_355/g.993  ORF Transcript_355/g.993 Transcript_355/m.993 type:complete len:395 (-) Transcript_355:99-1283(-)
MPVQVAARVSHTVLQSCRVVCVRTSYLSRQLWVALSRHCSAGSALDRQAVFAPREARSTWATASGAARAAAAAKPRRRAMAASAAASARRGGALRANSGLSQNGYGLLKSRKGGKERPLAPLFPWSSAAAPRTVRAMLRGLQAHEVLRSASPKRDEQEYLRSSKEGAAEFAARELMRVARKFMPTSVSLKDLNECDEQTSLPQEMRRVASQVLMRPNVLFQEIAGGATRRRPLSSSKVLLEDIPASRRCGALRRSSSEMGFLKRSSSDAQLADFAGLQNGDGIAGARLVPRRIDGILREEESEVMPVWQSKESDRPCLVPPLCSGTAQIEADKGFFAWANQIVQEVAEDATTANFTVSRVPGPPAMLMSTTEAIQPPSIPPPWQSFVPASQAVW